MFKQTAIDTFKFAREAGHLEGTACLSQFPRLREHLANESGTITYSLTGSDYQDKLLLKLSVLGEVTLTCQRCLGSFALALNIESKLIVTESEGDLQAV